MATDGVDSSKKKVRKSKKSMPELFTISPNENDGLTFAVQPKGSAPAVLAITNTTAAPIAFKVKTTKPDRYLVRPNQDVLAAGEEKQVAISVKKEEIAKIMQECAAEPEAEGGRTKSADKFQVQAASVDDGFFEDVSGVVAQLKQVEKDSGLDTAVRSEQLEQLATQKAKLLQDLWLSKKADVSHKKMRCYFEIGAAPVPSSPTPAASPPPYNPRAGTAEPGPAAEATPKLTTPAPASGAVPASPQSSNSTAATTTLGGDSGSAGSNGGANAGGDDGGAGGSASAAPSPAATPTGSSQTAVGEVKDLQQKYKHLLDWSTQTLEHIEKLKKENMMLKEEARRAAERQDTGIRNRKDGGASAAPAPGTPMKQRPGQVETNSSFGIQQVLIIAILCFLIGRFLA